MDTAALAPTEETRAAAAAYPAVTRLDSLDILRGLCAIAVALYHFDSWGGLNFPPICDGFLNVLGTYGVSVFFVLSGFSLAHAYGAKFSNGLDYQSLAKYVKRRAGRLIPLFSVVVFASIVGKILSHGNVPDILTVLANLSLLFGFVDPARTPVIGGWSIGVEVVFYVLFPLLVLVRRHRWAIVAISIFLAAWVDRSLVGAIELEKVWTIYVLPANHLVFFSCGALAALYMPRLSLDRPGLCLMFIPLILAGMIVVSYGATELEVVTGLRRVALVILSLGLVVMTAQVQVAQSASLLASILGGASYPLYLIHPLIFFLISRVIPLGSTLFIPLFCLAVVVAIGTDLIIDKPLQKRIKAAGW